MSLTRMLPYAFLAFSLTAKPQLTFDQNPFPTSAPAATQTPADQKCVLSGKVSNSLTGEPLRKVTLQLMPRGGAAMVGSSTTGSAGQAGASQSYSTTSQADGSFAIQDIQPGNYVLSGQRTGYLNTQYGGRRPLSTGSVLIFKPGQQRTELNLSLVPQAVIVGKVVDDDGDPLDGVTVQALHPQWQQGRMSDMPEASTQTNDLGEFRLAGVRPGKLYLVAQKMNFQAADFMRSTEPGKPDLRPVRTFYPEAISRDAATPIEVQAGQDLSGIDIRMHAAQTYHVRGKVAGVLPEGDGERMMIFVRPHDSGFGFFPGNQSFVGKGNTFDIPGIASGSYELILQSMGGKSRSATHQEIEVGTGDLNDIVVNIQPPATLKGVIRLEGTPSGNSAAANIGNLHVHLTSADSPPMFGPSPNATPGPDGSFMLENVSAGKYRLVLNSLNGAYLKSVKIGTQEILGKYLDLSGGAGGELDIVLRYGAAEVDGTVQAAQNAATSPNSAGGQAAAAAIVLLVPEELNEDGSGVKFGSAGQNGTFTFKQLTPGRYKVYAFEDATFADLQNPDVIKQMESKGTDVEVAESDKKQIQLPLISADEFQQALAKLGLDSSQ